MRRKVLLMVMAMVTVVSVRSQMLVDNWTLTTGVDTTLWASLEGKDTVLIAGGNRMTGASGVVDMGLAVRFGTGVYTQLSVNVNGTVRLGSAPASTTGYFNYPLGTQTGNGPKVEPFGSRGRFDSTCYARMARTTIGGEDVVVVETRLADYSNPSVHVTFQVQLFEESVRLVYGSVDGGTVSVGRQNGLVASSSPRDVLFIDFVSHEALRWDAETTTQELQRRNEVWPAVGRWYKVAFDSTLCPYPPEVAATGTDPADITLTSGTAWSTDLRVQIPAAGVDTLWPAGAATFALGAGFNPMTTYSGTVRGVCAGGQMSLRTHAFSFSTTCGPVAHMPWASSFSTSQQASCWSMNHYALLQSNTAWRWASSAIRCGENYAVYGYDSWLVSPAMALPDEEGITLEFDYRSEALSGVAPRVEVKVGVCDSSSQQDPVAWTTVLTLDTVFGTYTRFSVPLDAWRGERVKVNFVRTGDGGKYAYVDNFEVKQYLEPSVEVSVDGEVVTGETYCYAHVGDTLTAVCHLLTGVRTGETHTWYSSLLGALVGGDTLRYVYSEEGLDTLTLVHSNNYGSDTVRIILHVLDCHAVTHYPWLQDFGSGLGCWQSMGQGVRWEALANEGVDASGAVGVKSLSGQYSSQWLVSQPLEIPTDAYMLRLNWQMKRSTGSASSAMRRLAVLALPDSAQTFPCPADTLFYYEGTDLPTSWAPFEAALDSLAGRTVRLAFAVGLPSLANRWLYMDDLQVRYVRMPILSVASPHHASVGGSARLEAHLSQGDTVGLLYEWHSSLTGTSHSDTAATSTFTIAYSQPGLDTITLSATNAYGTAVDTILLEVCPLIDTFPWTPDLSTPQGPHCWDLSGFTYNDAASWITPELSGTPIRSYGYLSAVDQGSYIILPPMALPVGMHDMALEMGMTGSRNISLRLSTTGSTDTADFVEIARWQNHNLYLRKASLDPYAGQTVRLAIVSTSRGTAMLHHVAVDYDTLPILFDLQTPSLASTDAPALCTATLAFGSLDSLRYEWHSTMASRGLATLLPSGDTLRLRYLAGGTDTIRLVAINAYGSDTLIRTLTVYDCSPVLTLPWSEDFSHGIVCWSAPEGSNWAPFTLSYSTQRCISSSATTADTLDSWLLSKPILIPADSALMPTLFWEALSSSSYYSHHLEVYLIPDSLYTPGAPLPTVAPAYILDTTLPVLSYYSSPSLPHSLSLAPWCGQMVRVAFRHRVSQADLPGSSATLYIDNVEIRHTAAPQISLSGPTSILNDNLASFTATLLEGSTDSLTLSWHSSLLDTTFLGPLQLNLRYRQPGTDTLRLIATNPFGADTAQLLVSVTFNYKPHITLHSPQSVFVDDTTRFYVTRNDCYFDNHQFHWHSSMVDSNRAQMVVLDSQLFVVYRHPGIDTLLVIFSTNYSADTALTYVLVNTHPLPQILSFNAPSLVESGGTAPLSARINDCSANDLSLSLRSSLLDSTTSLPVLPASTTPFSLHYPYPLMGTDTLTLILSNRYGADTLVASLRVFVDSTLYAPASLTASDLTSSCATLSWSEVSFAERYLVQLGNLVDTVVDDLTLTLCDLNPNTTYTARVAAIGNGDTGAFASTSFRTECILLQIPAYFDFDSATNNGLPLCWKTAPSYAAHVNPPAVWNNQNGELALLHSLRSAYASTPIIDARGDSLFVFFTAWTEAETDTTTPNLEVGALFDPTDTNTFIPLFYATATSQPNYYQFSTRTLSPDPVAIAFRNPVAGRTLFIDNIGIRSLSSCPQPFGIRVSSTDPRSAEVSWHPGCPSDDSPVQQYDIYLADRADTLPLLGETPTLTVYDTVVTLNGLLPGHVYDAVLVTICGTDTLVSDTFTVAPSPSPCTEEVALPGDGTEDFDTSSNLVPFSYRGYNYSQTLYEAGLALPMDTLFGIAYHIVSTDGHGTDHLLDVYIGQTSSDSLPEPIPASQLTLAVQNFPFPVKDTGWVHINFTNPVPLDGEGNLIVTIDDNTGGFEISTNFYFATHIKRMGGVLRTWDENYDIDPNSQTLNARMQSRIVPDIQLLGQCNTFRCLPPVVTAEADTHSVRLSWAQRGVEPRWLVEYRCEGDPLWHVADSTYSDTYTVSGLAAATLYHFRVASLCEEGDTLWGRPLTVRTLCGSVAVPFEENFCLPQVSEPCWQLGGNSLLSDGRGLWITSSGLQNLVISPEIDASLDTLQATLVASGTTFRDCFLYVGACDADGSNLEWVDTLLLTDSAERYTIYFNRYQGTARHLAFMQGGWNPTIYSVRIEPLASCVPVRQLAVRHLMPTTATVEWRPQAGQNLWAVYLGGASQTAGQPSAYRLVGTTTDSVYRLTGLSPDASYTVAVRAICAAGDTSEAEVCAFTTPCALRGLPYVEDFSTYEEVTEPDCWRFNMGSEYAISHVLPADSNAYLSFIDHSSEYVNPEAAPNFAATPLLRVAGHPVTVRFRLRFNQVYDGNGSVQPGLMTDPADTATFVPLGAPIMEADTTEGGHIYEFVLDTLADSVVAVAFRWRGEMSAYLYEVIVHHWFMVTVVSADSTMGTVEGGGEYEYGDVAPLVATAFPGYRFVAWSDGDRSAVRSLVVTSDTLLRAFFALPEGINPVGDEAGEEVRIYPNPARSTVNVEAGEWKVQSVSLLDLEGREVYTLDVQPRTSCFTIDVGTLPRGAYYLCIKGEEGVAVRRLLVQ